MKKICLILLSLILIFILIPNVDVVADSQTSAPYDTYTTGPHGKIIKTQTAYEPAGTIKIGLKSPEDLYLKDDVIFIADTGNKRIIKYHLDGTSEVIITNLIEPTGVHVDEEDYIYVADKGARAVVKFDKLGNKVKTFEKPTELIFGTSPYIPLKIVTGPKGILYVVGEGSTAGLIQLSYNGEFQGFFAANETRMSFVQRVANFFQVSSAKNIPISPSNVAIDEKGSIYTVSNTFKDKCKKFNIASEAILKIHSELTPNSIHINQFNNIYILTNEGYINEYDQYGNIIFGFGQLDTGTQRLGLFVTPVDITTDSKNNIYVLDKGLNEIQIFERSEFAALVHTGLKNNKDGIYDIEQWQEVLRMNAMFSVANSAIARAEYRNQNYGEALKYYRIATDKVGYSEAYWQIRYDFLQKHMLPILIAIICLSILIYGVKFADRKWQTFYFVHDFTKKAKANRKVSEFLLLFKMFRHPIDTIHDIKRYNESSKRTATVLYVLFVVMMIIARYFESFIFSTIRLETANVFKDILILFGVVFLFVISNYLISSLQNGEGWLKDVFIATSYCLAPIIVFMPFITLISHTLTLNEIFIYQALNYITYTWVLINLVIMIKEVHNYTIPQLIGNILLTIFTMIVVVVIVALIIILGSQLYEYIDGIIKEVIQYVCI
ncbi:MAG: YIP1 family protein [Acholeplasmataceae bacterium]|jgi:hypothetical protein